MAATRRGMISGVPKFSGAVLAGGESRRMGRDKAELLLHGETLWQRQVRVLTEAGAESVTVVRRRGQLSLSDHLPHVWDSVENVGPLAGLLAALEGSTRELVAVIAVDLPASDPDFLRHLHSFCCSHAGAVARHAGRFEPLAAFYPKRALPQIFEQLESQDYSLQRLLTRLVDVGHMKAIEVPESRRSSFANANTPAEFNSHLANRP